MSRAFRFMSALLLLCSASILLSGQAPQADPAVPAHSAGITALRTSPHDSGLLASASADGSIKVWRIGPGGSVAALLGDFPAWTHEAVMAPDATWAAGALAGGEVRIWRLSDQRLLKVLRPHQAEVLCLAVSPDGSLLALGGAGGQMSLWSMPEGRLLTSIEGAHRKAVWDLDFSSDGRLLASASQDETLRFWTSQGQEVKKVDKFDGPVAAVAFSPAQPDRVAVASWEGAISRVEWRDSRGNRKGRPSRALFRVRSLAFSPDGQRLAAGGSGASILLWSSNNWSRPRSHYFQGEGLRSLTFSPDGTLLAGAGDDRHLRFWDASSGRLLESLDLPTLGSFTSVAFFPDGKSLLTSAWGALDGSSVKIHQEQGGLLALSPPAQAFATLAWGDSDGDGRQGILAGAGPDGIRLWTRDGGLMALLEPHSEVLALDFHSAHGLLAAAMKDGKVGLWRLQGERLTPEWTRPVHLGAATALRFLPDGQRIAVGGRDGFVRLLDSASGRPLAQARNDFSITGLDLDQEGRRLAWATVGPFVRWTDLSRSSAADPAGQENAGHLASSGAIQLDAPGVLDLDLSEDGRRLALITPDSLQLWELPSTAARQGLTAPDSASARRTAVRAGAYTALASLAQGRLATATGDGRIEILQSDSLQPVERLQDASQAVLRLEVEAQPVGRLDKAPLRPLRLSAPPWCGNDADGRCTTRRGLLVIGLLGPDLEDGVHLEWRSGGSRVRHSGFVSRSGTYLLPRAVVLEVQGEVDLAAGDHVLLEHLALTAPSRPLRPPQRRSWLWNDETEEWKLREFDLALQAFPELQQPLRLESFFRPASAGLLADAQQVLAYPGYLPAQDDAAGRPPPVLLADLAELSSDLLFQGHQASVNDLDISPDGKLLLSASKDQSVRLWDALTAQPLDRFSHHHDWVTSVAFSPDGRLAASGAWEGRAAIWEAAPAREAEQPVKPFPAHPGGVNALAFSPDSSILASAGEDAQVRLWSASGGSESASLEADLWLRAVAFSPDGNLLAAAGGQAQVMVWNADSRRELLRLGEPDESLTCLAFSPDSKMLAAGTEGGLVYLWELPSGRLMYRLREAEWISALAFSPDGLLLAVASWRDGMALWNPLAGTPVYSLAGHSGGTNAAVFSPDGRYLFTAGQDRQILRWPLPGQEAK